MSLMRVDCSFVTSVNRGRLLFHHPHVPSVCGCMSYSPIPALHFHVFFFFLSLLISTFVIPFLATLCCLCSPYFLCFCQIATLSLSLLPTLSRVATLSHLATLSLSQLITLSQVTTWFLSQLATVFLSQLSILSHLATMSLSQLDTLSLFS